MQVKWLSDDAGLVFFKVKGDITPSPHARENEPLGVLKGMEIYTQRLLLDLAEADYINSSGVAWLLTVHKRCRDRGGLLVLHTLCPGVADVLGTLRMDRVFNIADDEWSGRVLARGGDESAWQTPST